MYVLLIDVCPFVLFLLVIVLSVLLRILIAPLATLEHIILISSQSCTFFFWSLCCLFFFDLSPLVSFKLFLQNIYTTNTNTIIYPYDWYLQTLLKDMLDCAKKISTRILLDIFIIRIKSY